MNIVFILIKMSEKLVITFMFLHAGPCKAHGCHVLHLRFSRYHRICYMKKLKCILSFFWFKYGRSWSSLKCSFMLDHAEPIVACLPTTDLTDISGFALSKLKRIFFLDLGPDNCTIVPLFDKQILWHSGNLTMNLCFIFAVDNFWNFGHDCASSTRFMTLCSLLSRRMRIAVDNVVDNNKIEWSSIT